MPKLERQHANVLKAPFLSVPPELAALRIEWRKCKLDLVHAERCWKCSEEALVIALDRGLATLRFEQAEHIADKEVYAIKKRMREIKAMVPDLREAIQ